MFEVEKDDHYNADDGTYCHQLLFLDKKKPQSLTEQTRHKLCFIYC